MIVAQRDADGGGGVAEGIVDGRFACPAGHEGALEFEGFVFPGELLGMLGDEVCQRGIEDAGLVADADDDAVALAGVRLLGAAFDGDDAIGFAEQFWPADSGDGADETFFFGAGEEHGERESPRMAICGRSVQCIEHRQRRCDSTLIVDSAGIKALPAEARCALIEHSG